MSFEEIGLAIGLVLQAFGLAFTIWKEAKEKKSKKKDNNHRQ